MHVCSCVSERILYVFVHVVCVCVGGIGREGGHMGVRAVDVRTNARTDEERTDRETQTDRENRQTDIKRQRETDKDRKKQKEGDLLM